MRGQKTSKEKWNKFLKELEKMIGLVGAACEKVGIGRSTYYDHRIKDKEFAKEADNIIEQIGVAFAEDKLREAIFNGEGWAIKYFLMCKSKKWRPYTRTRIEGTIPIKQEVPKKPDPILEKTIRLYEKELKKELRKGVKK